MYVLLLRIVHDLFGTSHSHFSTMQNSAEKREALWTEHCGQGLRKLDTEVRTKAMVSLVNITGLRMIYTIVARGWWEEVLTVVTWMLVSCHKAFAAMSRDVFSYTLASLHKASWYLFGRDRCQIGKSIVVAIMAVVQKDSRSIAFALSNLRTHVDDVAQKTRQYLQEGGPGRWTQSFYTVETMTGFSGQKRLKDLPQLIRNSLLICSWRSKYQLDTLCALRYYMATDAVRIQQALPFIAADEWDLTRTSSAEDSVLERARQAVLGLTKGRILCQNKWELILGHSPERRSFFLPQPLSMIVMTSTPEGFLHDLAMKGQNLDGWCAPRPYTNFVGMECWNVHPYDTATLEPANKYSREFRGPFPLTPFLAEIFS